MKTYKQFLQILTEDRVDFLKDKYKNLSTEHDPNGEHKTPADVVDHFAQNADPTANKTYTDWIMGQYKKGHIKQEDDRDVQQTLQNFEKYKSKLPEKNINNYFHIDHLKTAMEPHLGTDPTYTEIPSHKDAPLIHSENGVQVHELNSKEASRHYFAGGSVCTARNDANCQHDYYSSMGKLYHVRGRDGKGGIKDYNVYLSDNDEKPNEYSDKFNNHLSSEELVRNNPELRNVSAFQFKDKNFNNEENTAKLNSLTWENALEIAKDKTQHPNLRAKAIHTWFIPDEETKKMLLDPSEHHVVKNAIIKGQDVDLTDEEVQKLVHRSGGFLGFGMQAEHPTVRTNVINNYSKQLGENDVNKIMDDSGDDTGVKLALMSNEKLKHHITSDRIHKMMMDNSGSGDSSVFKLAAMESHPEHITAEHIDNVLKSDNLHPEVKKKAIKRFGEFVTDDHVSKILNNSREHPEVKATVLGGSNVSKETLNKLAETNNPALHKAIMNHPNADGDVLHTIARKSKDVDVLYWVTNRNPSIQTLDLISSKAKDLKFDVVERSVNRTLASHPNLQSQHIDKLVGYADYGVIGSLASHPNLQSQHIDKLVGDTDYRVRARVASHPKLESQHIDKLLGDETPFVREIVAKHPLYKARYKNI